VKWIFFDCDNTLVLSETLAFKASFNLVNEVLAYKGIHHRYIEDEILVHFMGLSFKGMCAKMADEHEEEEVIKLFEKDLDAMPGIFDVLVQLVKMKRYNIAVVSSSSTKRIMSCLKKTGLDIFFLPQYIFSAADSLQKAATKPDPAIYLHALKELGVKPEDCVCVEDSRVGVKAAVQAGVPCVGLLASYNGRSKQEQLAIDFEKDGVTKVMWDWAQFFDILEQLDHK
jgi:beta-phosphoglucomutase-like phosphatase (HAD superfamily)